MRMMRTISARCRERGALARAGRGLFVLGVCLLASCGPRGGGGARPPSAHPPAAAHPAPKADPAAKALAAMVDAVGPRLGQAPVTLKFSLRKRPEVGEDDEIDYALIPNVPGLERLQLAFGSLEGLQVVSHGPATTAIKPASNVPIFGSVTIRPVKAGLYTLTAAIAVESPNRSVVWNFGIPVIAGEGPAQTASPH